MKRLIYWGSALFISFLFTTACNNNTDNSKKIEELSQKHAEEMAKEIDKDPTRRVMKEVTTSYTLEGKTIELDGHLIPPRANILHEDEKVKIALSKDQNGGGDDLAQLTIVFGENPNSIYFPEKFYLKDVVIYDNNGNKLTTADKLKVKAKVSYKAKGPIAKPVFDKNTPEVVKKSRMEIYEMQVAKGDGNDYTYTLDVISLEKL